MAGEQEIRPVDTQVARPVAAPNYVNMYAESIKAALEPFNYLLNYQKELSEEDYRKAEIQNFLSEHDLKTKELNETIRSHTAGEANQALERQLESAKTDEFIRHNKADELHSTAMEGLENRRIAIESLRERDEDRRAREEEDRLKAQEDYQQKELDLRSKSTESTIEAEKQRLEAEKTRQTILTSELKDRQNDEQVTQEMREWVSAQKPEDLFRTDENPEIQEKLNSFANRMHTQYGRDQYDFMVSDKTMLGQEVADRKQFNSFTDEGKRAFHETMDALTKDPNQNLTVQQRFNRSLESGAKATSQAKDRGTWSVEATSAYATAKNRGLPEDQAYMIGRETQQQYEKTLKEKEALKYPPKEQIESYKAMVPQIQGEKPEHYETRATSIAAQLAHAEATGDTDTYNKLMNQYILKPGPSSSASPYLQKKGFGPNVPPNIKGIPIEKPTSQLSPGQQAPAALTPLDQQQQRAPAQLAQATSPMLPETENNTTDLAQQFVHYFGGEEEETA